MNAALLIVELKLAGDHGGLALLDFEGVDPNGVGSSLHEATFRDLLDDHRVVEDNFGSVSEDEVGRAVLILLDTGRSHAQSRNGALFVVVHGFLG